MKYLTKSLLKYLLNLQSPTNLELLNACLVVDDVSPAGPDVVHVLLAVVVVVTHGGAHAVGRGQELHRQEQSLETESQSTMECNLWKPSIKVEKYSTFIFILMASPIYVINNTPTVLMAFEYSGRLNIIKFRIFAVSTHLPHGLVELESVC